MNFDLAKKLEVAGFHVRPIDEYYARYSKDSPPVVSGCIIIETRDGEEVEIPTLEELVEFVDGQNKAEEMTISYANKALKKLNYGS